MPDEDPDLIGNSNTASRRAVVNDLTTTCDVARPHEWKLIELPGTTRYRPREPLEDLDDAPVPPGNRSLPPQEPGVRPAGALSFALHARAVVQTDDGSVRIDLGNTGRAAAVFQVRSADPAHAPRTYTIQPGTPLSDVWNVAGIGATDYDLSVYAANGFLRRFQGSVAPPGPRSTSRPSRPADEPHCVDGFKRRFASRYG